MSLTYLCFIEFYHCILRIGVLIYSAPQLQGCLINLLTYLLFFLSFVFLVDVMFCFLAFGCQYQCSRLPGKTCLRN